MIEIKGIDKAYGKKRGRRQVLSSVDFSATRREFTVILGDSGSGKTTLLNIIGGLDKPDSGSVSFADAHFERYVPRHIDQLRAQRIGYVFQNYYLLPEETVYENIRLTLRMVGIDDEREIQRRINHLLELVHLSRYKNRRASRLSGGQMQRVAIVRALAKDPDVIIADEPTGNLDHKNTVEIMRILKAISQEKLVIMVTHEKALAAHYADRVYSLDDGVLEEASLKGVEEYSEGAFESDIHLGDLDRITEEKGDAGNVTLYSDDTLKKPFNVRLIVKNNTLYVDAGEAFKDVHVIDEDSEVSVQEGSSEESEDESAPMIYTYSSDFRVEKKGYRRAFPPSYIFERVKRRFKGRSKFTKVLYAAFALGAVFFAASLYILANIVSPDEASFLEEPRYAFEVEDGAMSDYGAFESLYLDAPAEGHALKRDSERLEIDLPFFYQAPPTYSSDVYLAPLAAAEGELVAGAMPEAPGDIVLSERLAEEMANAPRLNALGFDDPEDFVGLSHRLPMPASFATGGITGIVESNANAYFADDLYITERLDGQIATHDFLFATDKAELTDGRMPEDETEILSHVDEMEDFEVHERIVRDETYDVVGLYASEFSEGPLLSGEAMHKQYYHTTHGEDSRRLLYTDDSDAMEEYLDELNIAYRNLYDERRSAERTSMLQDYSGLYVFSIAALLATGLSFYFIIRSSMMQRVYEIGVYRSLGVRRTDLLHLFSAEAIALTTATSAIGYLAATYVLHRIQGETEQLIELFRITPFTVVGGLLVVYAINLLFGIAPLLNLLRRTPAEIHSTYDL